MLNGWFSCPSIFDWESIFCPRAFVQRESDRPFPGKTRFGRFPRFAIFFLTNSTSHDKNLSFKSREKEVFGFLPIPFTSLDIAGELPVVTPHWAGKSLTSSQACLLGGGLPPLAGIALANPAAGRKPFPSHTISFPSHYAVFLKDSFPGKI